MEGVTTINNKPKSLAVWNDDTSRRKLETIGSDIIALIEECMSLKSKLRKTKEDARKEKKELLLKFPEILDAFDRAFNNIESKVKDKDMDKQTAIWIGYFRSIRKLEVERILSELGSTVIETAGRKALPGLHTVAETRKVEGVEDDTIIEEKERGYLWDGEVLRKSKVVVVKNKEE